MRTRVRHPGSPVPHKRRPSPGMLSKFHQLLQSCDASVPSSLQLTFWGACSSACRGAAFGTCVKWGDEEGSGRRQTGMG